MPEFGPLRLEHETIDVDWLRGILAGSFIIEDVTVGAAGGRATRLRGRFVEDTSTAYARLAPRFRERGYTLMFRREKDEDVILVMHGVIKPTANNTWLPIVLAIATVASMLVSYVLIYEVNELSWRALWAALPKGLPFTLSLISILLVHELGHYFAARYFGVAVTLPYLIPFPLIGSFGTLGAVIRMKDIPPSKRAMLLIGAAGPCAGLAVAIPILIVGLSLSPVSPLPSQGGYIMEGNSLLYLALKYAIFGRLLPSGGEDVMLHPLALAGWAGLLVTSFNLIPAAQLDGGHIAYTLLGFRARYLTYAMIAVLVVMALVWPGWLLWAGLIFMFSRFSVRPLDDCSPLEPAEMMAAILLLVIFVLTFTPVPLRVIR